MQKQNLTRASQELFRRAPDERYASLDDLWRHCQESKERSTDYWRSPAEIRTVPTGSRLDLMLGSDDEESKQGGSSLRRFSTPRRFLLPPI